VASSRRCNDVEPAGSGVVEEGGLVDVVAAAWTEVVVVCSAEEGVDAPAHAATINRHAPRAEALILMPVRRSRTQQGSPPNLFRSETTDCAFLELGVGVYLSLTPGGG